MKYQSSNGGFLSADMVKDGDRVEIMEPIFSTEYNGKTYWNGRVKLPDGIIRMGSFMEMFLDDFAKLWGDETEKWVGKVLVVTIKTGRSGNPYVYFQAEEALKSTQASEKKADDAMAEVAGENKGNASFAAKKRGPVSVDRIEYPTEEINPEDIPF